MNSKHKYVKQHSEKKPEFKAHKQPKILVVEDNSHYIQQFVEMMRQLNY
jgi:hypothetical protein